MQQNIKIEFLLEEVVRSKASDLHLQVGSPPILRIDGTLSPLLKAPALNAQQVEELIKALIDESQEESLINDKELDFSFAFGNLARFRANAFYERGHLALSLRIIPSAIPSVESLGLPEVVSTFIDFPRGLVLVAGPTGSGKSTTLAALINKINAEKACHIITVEDPIEFAHVSQKAIISQREVHYDTFSFAAALRSALRQDPDIVLIGELRDLETIASAITIAETGHLVFATLHTNSASQSIDRIIDVFPSHQQAQIRSQLANIIQGICCQRLIPAIEGGRVAAAEILVANSAVRTIIREGKTHQLDAVIQTGADQGMQTMDRTLVKLVKTGVISHDEAKNYIIDPSEFNRLVRS